MKSLERWQPFRELNSLQRQMNRMFDNFFGRTPLMPFEESSSAWEFGSPVETAFLMATLFLQVFLDRFLTISFHFHWPVKVETSSPHDERNGEVTSAESLGG